MEQNYGTSTIEARPASSAVRRNGTYPDGIFELFGLRSELVEFVHLGQVCGLGAPVWQGHHPSFVVRSAVTPVPLRLQTDAL